MGQTTQPYKRSVAGSVGAGMKSVFGGEGRRFYSLVHKVSSKYHKVGETQHIIVDEIELGRDPRCQVRYDENFQTVSRRHAAIIKDGENWKLVQLSKTNPTFLNGRQVANEWYLQNGDEIQLSTNGPKLGFIIPEGKKGLVSSLNLTARLNLFRQQALRPYKQAIATMSCILGILLAVGCYFGWDAYSKIDKLKSDAVAAERLIAETKAETARTIDSLNEVNARNQEIAESSRAEQERKIRRLEGRLREVAERPAVPTPIATGVDNSAIDACLPHIYFIQTYKYSIRMPSGESGELQCGVDNVPGWTGTGFMLEDGRFVTARHVTEGWYFWASGGQVDENMLLLNQIATNGGQVVCHFIAISASGDTLEFSSDQFIVDRSHDQAVQLQDGSTAHLAPLDETDFSYMRTSRGSGLPYNSTKSTQLERGTKLTVLGFPLGLGANAVDDINPIYGSGIVAAPGLNQNVILTTDTNYEQGNSGGPVFYTDENGRLVVIGIVSAGAGRVTGFVVPISAIR